MNKSPIHLALYLGALGIVGLLTGIWVGSAASRFEHESAIQAEPEVAVATASDEGYCTFELKQILRRVLTSCGLVKKERGRGCQPLEAQKVAAMSGEDFNALFRPLASRAAILQFEADSAALDESATALLDKTFSDQRGASYFFVVSRASPDGSVEYNRSLSEKRARAVLDHLTEKFRDPDLDQEVGLLWLGEEFAQLEKEFCGWARSRSDGTCSANDLNRSAFIAWIDCRL